MTVNNLLLPLTLEWIITNSCNLKCKYCGDNPPFRNIDYSGILKKVIDLAKHIWIGGGEPTLVKQLPKILNSLKNELGAHIGLNTNLTSFDIVKDSLESVDDMIVSIDTADVDINKSYRQVDPLLIIENIRKLSVLAKNKNKRVNITVNTVVYRESLLNNNGIEKLNDLLFEIDNSMCQMFCPVYPADSKESIINDREATRVFYLIMERLKQKKRNIMVVFPESAEGNKFVSEKYRCYRSFFRIRLEENNEFRSPCPVIDISNPTCNSPCNCAAFIDDIINMKDAACLVGSPINGKLNIEDVEVLKKFHKMHLNKEMPDKVYAKLLKQ